MVSAHQMDFKSKWAWYYTWATGEAGQAGRHLDEMPPHGSEANTKGVQRLLNEPECAAYWRTDSPKFKTLCA
jgi:hypothetical protein